MPSGQELQTAAVPGLWEMRQCAGVRASAAFGVGSALLLGQAGMWLALLLRPQDPLLQAACASSCPWCLSVCGWRKNQLLGGCRKSFARSSSGSRSGSFVFCGLPDLVPAFHSS